MPLLNWLASHFWLFAGFVIGVAIYLLFFWRDRGRRG